MPNHGGNLLTFFELSMMHPFLEKEKEREREKEKSCEKKKKGVEIAHMFVCLVVLMWA